MKWKDSNTAVGSVLWCVLAPSSKRRRVHQLRSHKTACRMRDRVSRYRPAFVRALGLASESNRPSFEDKKLEARGRGESSLGDSSGKRVGSTLACPGDLVFPVAMFVFHLFPRFEMKTVGLSNRVVLRAAAWLHHRRLMLSRLVQINCLPRGFALPSKPPPLIVRASKLYQIQWESTSRSHHTKSAPTFNHSQRRHLLGLSVDDHHAGVLLTPSPMPTRP